MDIPGLWDDIAQHAADERPHPLAAVLVNLLKPFPRESSFTARFWDENELRFVDVSHPPMVLLPRVLEFPYSIVTSSFDRLPVFTGVHEMTCQSFQPSSPPPEDELDLPVHVRLCQCLSLVLHPGDPHGRTVRWTAAMVQQVLQQISGAWALYARFVDDPEPLSPELLDALLGPGSPSHRILSDPGRFVFAKKGPATPGATLDAAACAHLRNNVRPRPLDTLALEDCSVDVEALWPGDALQRWVLQCIPRHQLPRGSHGFYDRIVLSRGRNKHTSPQPRPHHLWQLQWRAVDVDEDDELRVLVRATTPRLRSTLRFGWCDREQGDCDRLPPSWINIAGEMSIFDGTPVQSTEQIVELLAHVHDGQRRSSAFHGYGPCLLVLGRTLCPAERRRVRFVLHADSTRTAQDLVFVAREAQFRRECILDLRPPANVAALGFLVRLFQAEPSFNESRWNVVLRSCAVVLPRLGRNPVLVMLANNHWITADDPVFADDVLHDDQHHDDDWEVPTYHVPRTANRPTPTHVYVIPRNLATAVLGDDDLVYATPCTILSHPDAIVAHQALLDSPGWRHLLADDKGFVRRRLVVQLPMGVAVCVYGRPVVPHHQVYLGWTDGLTLVCLSRETTTQDHTMDDDRTVPREWKQYCDDMLYGTDEMLAHVGSEYDPSSDGSGGEQTLLDEDTQMAWTTAPAPAAPQSSPDDDHGPLDGTWPLSTAPHEPFTLKPATQTSMDTDRDQERDVRCLHFVDYVRFGRAVMDGFHTYHVGHQHLRPRGDKKKHPSSSPRVVAIQVDADLLRRLLAPCTRRADEMCPLAGIVETLRVSAAGQLARFTLQLTSYEDDLVQRFLAVRWTSARLGPRIRDPQTLDVCLQIMDTGWPTSVFSAPATHVVPYVLDRFGVDVSPCVIAGRRSSFTPDDWHRYRQRHRWNDDFAAARAWLAGGVSDPLFNRIKKPGGPVDLYKLLHDAYQARSAVTVDDL